MSHFSDSCIKLVPIKITLGYYIFKISSIGMFQNYTLICSIGFKSRLGGWSDHVFYGAYEIFGKQLCINTVFSYYKWLKLWEKRKQSNRKKKSIILFTILITDNSLFLVFGIFFLLKNKSLKPSNKRLPPEMTLYYRIFFYAILTWEFILQQLAWVELPHVSRCHPKPQHTRQNSTPS